MVLQLIEILCSYFGSEQQGKKRACLHQQVSTARATSLESNGDTASYSGGHEVSG